MAVLLVVCRLGGVAHAGGKKRVVVLDFDGPKAEKFHDEVEKAVKKQHTIVPTDKWNGTAEELDAGTLNKDNIKKVAKKLKIDAVVTGKVEKRGGDYIVKLKVRDGKTGAVVGGALEAAVENGKIASASKGELTDAIAGLEAKGGDDAVAEDKPKKGKKDDAEDKPKKGKKDEAGDEDKPKFSKKDDMERGGDKVGLDGKKDKKDKKGKKDEVVEEDKPKKGKKDDVVIEDKPKKEKVEVAEDSPKPKKGKKTASTDEGETRVDEGSGDKVSPSSSLAPADRAVDVALGMSFVARRLSFESNLEGALIPPGYKQTIPVPGALIDATLYPLAFGHKDSGITKNLGIAVLFDQVLLIKSQINNPDGSSTSLATTESHYSFGGAFRIPFGSMLVTATLSYSRQSFSIAHPSGLMVDMPSVQYGMVEPAIKVHYPFSDKLTIVGKVGGMIVLSTGDISQATEYGKGGAYGIDFELGGEYMLTHNIFARASVRADSIKMSFNGSGDKTKNRDGDLMDQDVFGARDTYFGAAATVGYLY